MFEGQQGDQRGLGRAGAGVVKTWDFTLRSKAGGAWGQGVTESYVSFVGGHFGHYEQGKGRSRDCWGGCGKNLRDDGGLDGV